MQNCKGILIFFYLETTDTERTEMYESRKQCLGIS